MVQRKENTRCEAAAAARQEDGDSRRCAQQNMLVLFMLQILWRFDRFYLPLSLHLMYIGRGRGGGGVGEFLETYKCVEEKKVEK